MMLALLIAAQPAPGLVEQADRASQAYIGCLFATSREAHGARLPPGEFDSKLANACQTEQRAAQRLMTRLLSERGEASPASKAEQMMGEARSSVSATYESLQRIGPQLEKVAEICRQQPDACR
jgi:hypothetical protein